MMKTANVVRSNLRRYPVSLYFILLVNTGHVASPDSRERDTDFPSQWPPNDKEFVVIFNVPHKTCHIQNLWLLMEGCAFHDCHA